MNALTMEPERMSSAECQQREMEVLLALSTQLARTAGLSLGMSVEVLPGLPATILAGDKSVAVVPVNLSSGGRLHLLLSVLSDHLVFGEDGPARALRILHHAPDALLFSSAALGASPAGFWMLFRVVHVALRDSPRLAHLVQETLRLTEFVLGSEGHVEH